MNLTQILISVGIPLVIGIIGMVIFTVILQHKGSRLEIYGFITAVGIVGVSLFLGVEYIIKGELVGLCFILLSFMPYIIFVK